MPCRYDPTPSEMEASRKAAEKNQRDAATNAKKATRVDKLEADNHALSVKLDYAQDLIYDLWEALWYEAHEVPEEDNPLRVAVERVLKEQTRHRQDDLDRVLKVLAANPTNKNRDLMKKVLNADPSKPLERQLGFNPDDY